MTEQYNQGGINLLDAEPKTATTPDATPVLLDLGALTADGDTLTTMVFGGGSNPAAPTTDDYTVLMRCTFTRQAGVVTATTQNITLDQVGAPVILAFVVGGPLLDRAQISITGPAFPYNHRLKATVDQF